MKHKLVLIAETVMDGVGKHVVDLIDYLDKSFFEIYVIHGIHRTDYRFSEIKLKWAGKVTFIPVDTLYREIDPANDLKAFREIRGHLKAIGPDIVHCHSSKAGVLGRIAAKSLGIQRVFYTPHAYAMQGQSHWTSKRRFYWLIEKTLAHFATRHTFNVSEGEKQFAVDLGVEKPDHFVVAYNALSGDVTHTNPEALKKELGIPEEAFVVGCVARLFYQKNPEDFFKIAKLLLEQDPNYRFIWVGTGEMMDAMKAWCREAGIYSAVYFVGHRKNVDAYLNLFDVFLSTSHYEGLPYTLVEAMRASCPIVASDVVGNNEVVISGVNGFLYAAGKVQSGVNAINRLKMDEGLKRQMSESGYNRFQEFFTIDQMISKIEKFYKDSL